MARQIHPVVVGTAGHIDHGKSSLVKALTGIDPDRLKEEKERGLTIDLGFARLRLGDGRWLGLVDVPGHERFVRNMVAGCTGLDLAMLVVAADDGVMPQTIEHVDILDLLGVRGGLIVLTKIDMVDPALADMAADEVRKLVQGTVMASAEVVRVSSITGEGIPELKQKLEAQALAVEPRQSHGPFRMPIQRVFSLPGIGTVVTGIPMSGAVRQGAEIEILPIGERVKVRGIHAYGGKVEEAVAGHSTALSVPDARESGVHRGMVCCEPGTFTVGDAVDIDLALTLRSPRLAHRAPIRFHTGTIEVRGQLLLLDRDATGPGESLAARLELDEDVCCAHNDRFLLRLQNPAVTIGGGRVLRLQHTGRYRRKDLGNELAGILAAGDRPEARIEHELEQAGPEGRTVDDLARALETTETKVLDTVATMPETELHQKAMRVFQRRLVAAGEQELLQSVDRMLHQRPAAASIKRTALRTTKTLPQVLVDCVFDRLQAAGRVRTGRQGQILFLDRLKPLPPQDQQRLDRIVAECEQRGFRPPELAEIEAACVLRGDPLLSLLDRAQDEGRIDKVGDHYYGASVVRKVMRAIRTNCLRHGEILDIPSLRDGLDTSRKYLIPLLEYIDAQGLTVLRGGVRRLLPSSDLSRELASEG
ncbi:MAG TPA: selenocysteine-specific translation elongation factor [Planctomycetota bacterium]|nr:selenocysteine-specific translation elongation factor [Planctomycetota bacterium]